MRSRKRFRFEEEYGEKVKEMQLEPDKIYTTKRYDIFKTMTGNREISKKHVERLKENISARGLITPIVINKNMEIVDGQHRFEACKELGVAVRFSVSDRECGIKEVSEINRLQKSWTMADIINSMAKNGDLSYQWLLKMMREHKTIHNTAIQRVVGCPRGRNANWESFKLSMFDMAMLERKLEYLELLVDDVKKMGGKSDNTFMAISFLYDHPLVDNDRLKKILHIATAEWIPTTTVSGVLSQIEKYYNKGLRTNIVPICFDYKKFLLERDKEKGRRLARLRCGDTF